MLRVRNSELEDTEASLEVGPQNAFPRNAEAQYKHCLGARDWTRARHTPPSRTQERPDSPPQAGSLQPSQALSCPAHRHQMQVLPDPVASHLRNVIGNSCCLPGINYKLSQVFFFLVVFLRSNSGREGLLPTRFYRQGNQGPELLSDLPKGTVMVILLKSQAPEIRITLFGDGSLRSYQI